jgi:hypothetical protein
LQLHGAVVWVAETRLSSGKLPVLDATLCADIDSQATAPLPSDHAHDAMALVAEGI